MTDHTKPDADELREDILDFIVNRPGWFDAKRGKDYSDNVLKEYDRLKARADMLPKVVKALEALLKQDGHYMLDKMPEYKNLKFGDGFYFKIRNAFIKQIIAEAEKLLEDGS